MFAMFLLVATPLSLELSQPQLRGKECPTANAGPSSAANASQARAVGKSMWRALGLRILKILCESYAALTLHVVSTVPFGGILCIQAENPSYKYGLA
jgi:hypothetical protein